MTDTPTMTLNSETDSASCGTSDSMERNSLNSLIEGKEKGCVGDCTNDCTGNQYSISCADGPSQSKRRKCICFNSIGQSVWGVILIIASISGFIFPPLDVMLWEKLNMRPGFPPYDWWADPPDEVKMRAYVFNVTNHERFLQGLDSKMNVEEIGPIVYLEKLKHYNMQFNENSTLTYTAERYLIYLPDDNTIDLNQTLVVPNLAVLGLTSYLHNANYFVRSGLKFLVNTHGSKFFVKKTIHEYLWHNKDPILETSQHLAPGLVPSTNMGMLSRVYADFVDDITVKIGPQWGHHDFFKIDKVRGLSQISGYDPDVCPDRLFGATEGVMYHQHLSKNDVLYCWRKTVCKLMPLYFDKEITLEGVPLYRYNLSENVFDRVKNSTDCYAMENTLPDGISDASKCFYDFPMVASYPHFYTGSPAKDTFVTGLKPDRYKHNSYVMVEPMTGIPFRAVARMQCNMRINNISAYYSPDYLRFSNTVIPIGWIEYNQEGLPTHVRYTIYFMVNVLPPLSVGFFIITTLLGFYLITKQIFSHKLKKFILPSIMNFQKQKAVNLTNNGVLAYEKENFLKQSSKS
ncbi:lysosome membrane protein 2-like [Pararge aegeria]|uniref:lysosome membrane protein 2-like n=1 Tax=Pararge aegeria TaxID=116150 RepID=UPI0019D0807B|nr:lysosome membrane protein 2-like [Pararge aegeria]